MKRRKPDAQSKHVRALQRELEQVRHHTPVGVKRLVAGFPELRDLHSVVAELLDLSDPRAGRNLNGSRPGTPSFLSADGRSTREGRTTLPDRQKVHYWRRRVGGLVEQMRSDLDSSHRTPDPRPRCHRRSCEGRGRRQPVGVMFCGFCREPINEKKQAGRMSSRRTQNES